LGAIQTLKFSTTTLKGPGTGVDWNRKPLLPGGFDAIRKHSVRLIGRTAPPPRRPAVHAVISNDELAGELESLLHGFSPERFRV
jgi:hypothetical protein